MILKFIASNFFFITLYNPGLNELNPCFEYGLFELKEEEVKPVLRGITNKFEEEGWTCRSVTIPIGISCVQNERTLSTRAVCETAVNGIFRYYYYTRNGQGEEPEWFVGGFAIVEPKPVEDDFGFNRVDDN